MMGPWTVVLVIVSLTASLCAVARGQVSAEPVITNGAETVQETVGSTAVFNCRVQNLGDYKVTWTFVSHDFVIFEGNTLMTSHPSKYTLLQSHDHIYDLQILDIELSDHGYYKCSVGSDSIISHLEVTDLEPLPLPDDPDGINVTDCCIAKGVSATCLPTCYPANIPRGFDVIGNCRAPADVIGLIDCFNGGSNHDTCCLDRGVEMVCLDFCHSAISLTPEAASCLNGTSVYALVSCAVSGAEHFPSAPTSVAAIAVNTGSPAILIKWAPPEKNADAVTGYKIMYRRVTDTKDKSYLIQDRGVFMHRLSGDILPNQGYIVHLVALASHGISLGSPEIEIYVSDESVQDMGESIDDCCERRNVPASCRDMLCRSKTWSEFHTANALRCFPYLSDVFTCLAGERNHTGCCQAFEVTPVCLPVCSGSPPAYDASLSGCVAQMSLIEACVQQGFSSQPAPPTNLMVQHVTNNLAQIAFDPSVSNVTRYIVLVRTDSKDAPFELKQTLSPTTSTFELNNLAESTFYWVKVVAETEAEASLFSETVSFLTYSESYDEPEERPARLDPYDFRGCCVDSGMPSVCADGCIYQVNMTDYYKQHLATCYSHIGSVLSCASDGRDHRNCCRRRNIKVECEDLCVQTKLGELDSRFVPVCIPETATAVFCYNEGLWSLPKYPDVVVTDRSIHTITLNWTHPESGAIVDSYGISYKPANASPNKTITMTTSKFGFILQDLQPATAYDIEAFSVNENGTSARSPTITEFTLEDIPQVIPVNISEPPQDRAFWQNITHCCENTVSAACRDLCLNKESAMDQAGVCFKESNTMLACLSDGQDHRVCCEERNLPSVCLSICGGKAISDNIAQATCMSYAYREIIYSCFFERQGLIPKAPLSFSAKRSDTAALNVTLSWAVPGFCGSDCYYTVHWWDETDTDKKTTQKIWSTSVVIAVDTINRHYKFMVVAHNSYGSGPPSAIWSLYVEEYARDVKVYLLGGSSTADQGTDVRLVCSIADFPQDIRQMVVRWHFNNRRYVGLGQFLDLSSVSMEDEGTYTCEVTDYFATSSGSFYLPIKAAPTFDQMKIESIPPGLMGRTAKIACWFRGYPDSDEHAWTKDGSKLEENLSKLSMSIDQRYHTGITSYRLKIADVVESDYGDYSITVSNKFGSTSCHVALRNPEDEDVIDVAPAVANPTQCCAERGVPSPCRDLCAFNVNVSQALMDPKYLSCLQYFESFVTCGADGRDHTKCCHNSAVVSTCQPLCRGMVPSFVESDPSRLIRCIGDWQQVIQCMETGSNNLPFKPESLVLTPANNGRDIVITWDPPTLNADKVDHYVIYYAQNGSAISKHVSLSRNIFRFLLTGLEPLTHYEIWMVSSNKFGQSLPTSKSEIETSDFILGLPVGLTVSFKPESSSVTLTWRMLQPEYYPSYTVYYKMDTDTSYKQVPNVKGTSYTLTGLYLGRSYVVYVKGVGQVMSLPSDTVQFTLKGNSPDHLTVNHIPNSPNVMLSWNMTDPHNQYFFNIYYKRDVDKDYEEIPNIGRTSYILTGLNPGQTYLAYVVAIGAKASLKSETIEFTTQDVGNAEKQSKKDDADTDKIAIGVGVTVAVIALIAIVLLVLFFVLRGRVTLPKVNDTVAYENPGFGSNAAGSVKFQGMDDSSFNYGHLEEEGGAGADVKVPEHVYDNTGFVGTNGSSSVQTGEINSETQAYENPTYLKTNLADPPMAPNGTGNDSVATLELNQS
ncbi:hypothetical protein EGW08_002364 [Elysia chlorotica]|uniref:Receptor protein-tyrosine kinase n=1 Tax=Elysia chlorotica TaxID=188477 RepID=A0A3S1AEK3_ELYCH|nr:hypothetical protein EGW08_002364 [Elysia chlorotica]